jgi:hypothetical protein
MLARAMRRHSAWAVRLARTDVRDKLVHDPVRREIRADGVRLDLGPPPSQAMTRRT